MSLKPCDTVIGIDRGIVPDRGGVQHRVVVNFTNSGAVFFAGMTNDHDGTNGSDAAGGHQIWPLAGLNLYAAAA